MNGLSLSKKGGVAGHVTPTRACRKGTPASLISVTFDDDKST